MDGQDGDGAICLRGFANLLYVMGEENGKAFMKKLGEQKIVYRGGRTLNTELLAAGEFSLGIALYLHRARDIRNKGGPHRLGHARTRGGQPPSCRTLR